LKNYLPFMFHPWAWSRWVPEHLLTEYVKWDAEAAVGFGHSPTTGFFVLAKNEETGETTLLHQEREGTPEAPPADPSIEGFKFAVPTGPAPAKPLEIKGLVLSTEAMQQLLQVPASKLNAPLKKKVGIVVRDRRIMYVRIADALYEVLSVETLGKTPA